MRTEFQQLEIMRKGKNSVKHARNGCEGADGLLRMNGKTQTRALDWK